MNPLRTRSWSTATAVVCALTIGIGLRATLEPSPVQASPATSAPQSRDGADAEDSVEAFYRGVITGDFASSAAYSVEPLPTSAPDAPVLVTARAFSTSLTDELGPYGLNTGIADLSARDLGPIDSEVLTGAHEARTLAAISMPDPPMRAIEISGRLVGRCSIGEFDRVVVVARLEGTWKILLEGRQGPKQPRFETWFLTRDESHSGALLDVPDASAQERGE